MLKYITYKGEKYPIRVNYYVLMMAEEAHGEIDYMQLLTKFSAQKDVLWWGLEAGHKMANMELSLKREDMQWVLDESYKEFQKILIAFTKELIDMKDEVLNDSDSGVKKK